MDSIISKAYLIWMRIGAKKTHKGRQASRSDGFGGGGRKEEEVGGSGRDF